MNYNEIKKRLLHELSDHQLVSHLKKISKNFTSNRDKIEDYLLGEENVSAYAATYLPSNMKKFDFILDQLPSKIIDSFNEYDFYDIGAGPGTYSLAFLERFSNSRKGELFVIDKSELMIKQARKLISGIFPGAENVHYSFPVKKSSNKKILFFGNSINEMGASEFFKIVNELVPEVIFFIEPGTKQFFEQALLIRKDRIKKGYQVAYPCMSTAGCPLANVDDWCHQILRTTYEQKLERIFQMAQIDRRTMSLISHLYIKEGELDSTKARIVRFIRESKFSFDYQVCICDELSQLRIIEFEVLKKGMSKSELKTFSKTSVGQYLKFEVIKEISDKRWRVSLMA